MYKIKKNEENEATSKLLGLSLDEENNICVDIEENNKYFTLTTEINIREVFDEAIRIILSDFKVDYEEKDIEEFLDIFMISNENGIEMTELYRGLIEVAVDDYAKTTYPIYSYKKNGYVKIPSITLRQFLLFDLKRIAINYILSERFIFIKYYVVIINKEIEITFGSKKVKLIHYTENCYDWDSFDFELDN